jgi:isopenicillin-N N-acyltransferase-like protein
MRLGEAFFQPAALMFKFRHAILPFFLAWLALGAASSSCAEPFSFVEGTFEQGRLRYLNGLPVLEVQGTPEEMGRQQAMLVSDAARRLICFPAELLAVVGREDRWPEFVRMGKAMLPQFPAHHLAELESFAKTSGCEADLLVGLNTMIDTYRGGLGCSSLLVAPERSATGGPLFGRNLDFFTLGKLQQYTLVTVYRPEGKHAFASVIFPGLFGCLSGINDAGLAVAVHEVHFSRDGGTLLDPKGVPYTLGFRRVLEECSTVEEARKLVASMKRTTLLNLAVCDRQGGAVLEITPKNVVLRRGSDGLAACTNHFRSPTLAMFAFAWRYRLLMSARDIPRLDVVDVQRKLHAANLGRLTMQTMIFEPEPLVLHLAYGSCPSSALPLKRLELAPLFERTD